MSSEFKVEKPWTIHTIDSLDNDIKAFRTHVRKEEKPFQSEICSNGTQKTFIYGSGILKYTIDCKSLSKRNEIISMALVFTNLRSITVCQSLHDFQSLSKVLKIHFPHFVIKIELCTDCLRDVL
jgi:hypothetical protein